MKKWLLLIISIFLITGCKVEYNITINDNLSVSESVNMTGTDDFFDVYYKTLRINVIKMMLESNDNGEYLKNNGYSYDVISNDKYPYVLAKKDYDNVSSYIDSSIFFEQYFDNVKVMEKDNIVTIEASGFKPNSPQDLSRFDIKNATISITSKYKVTDSNADSVSKEDNKYTWIINSDTKDKSIILSFDNNKKYDYIDGRILNIIIGAVVLFIIAWGIVIFNKKK